MTTAMTADTIEPDSCTDDELTADSGSSNRSSSISANQPVRNGDREDNSSNIDSKNDDKSKDDSLDMDLSNPLYTCAFLCKWDFKGTKPQQVSASRGDILDLLNKDYDDFGWWTVQSTKGKVGLMPKKWLTPAYEKIVVD